ncbi:MAG: amidase [Proteobacteria bacterium]|nr:amidase [Pseudomonadota bacterium]
MIDIPFQSATELARAIRENRIGSAELLEIYIERHRRLNPGLNAIVATDFENAGIRARQADQALSRWADWGTLHGVPVTIKDDTEVAGLPCTWGAPMFENHRPTRHADVVQSLVDAGAIVFGKTNLPFFGQDTQTFNEVYGLTNNPWDLARSPGGSSGGAAAALAAGLTGLEMGSDIGGSIRLPSHFCGVYGHKPTYGIVPMHGKHVPVDFLTIDHVVAHDIAVCGPLARSAEDLELAMDLIVGPSRPQRRAIKIALPPPRKKALEEYRIGLWIDDPVYPPDTEVGDCLQKMADDLSKVGAEVVERKPDIDLERCGYVFGNLVQLAGAYGIPQDVFDLQIMEAGKLDKGDQGVAAKYLRAAIMRHRGWQLLDIERSLMRQKWADYFQEFDVLLCPVARIPAFHHDPSEQSKRITRFNDQDLPHVEVVVPWSAPAGVSYLPATVAPIGFTPNGLPVGVQIVGPYLEDRTPIHVAKLMENTFGGFTPPPGFE